MLYGVAEQQLKRLPDEQWHTVLIIRGTDKRPQDRRPLRQKATGQKATERNVKMLLSCQDVLERLRVVLKTVEQIVLSSVLVCMPSLCGLSFICACELLNDSNCMYRPSLSMLTANN